MCTTIFASNTIQATSTAERLKISEELSLYSSAKPPSCFTLYWHSTSIFRRTTQLKRITTTVETKYKMQLFRSRNIDQLSSLGGRWWCMLLFVLIVFPAERVIAKWVDDVRHGKRHQLPRMHLVPRLPHYRETLQEVLHVHIQQTDVHRQQQ